MSWLGGDAYFELVSVVDLGNGTERVTYRNLTPVPAANSLSFRLVTDGGSPSLLAYNPISGTGVPSMPWWVFGLLLAMLPLMAARFLSRPIGRIAHASLLLSFGLPAAWPLQTDGGSRIHEGSLEAALVQPVSGGELVLLRTHSHTDREGERPWGRS